MIPSRRLRARTATAFATALVLSLAAGRLTAHAGAEIERAPSARVMPDNIPPTVRITCPEPSPLDAVPNPPAIRILWEGFDPDGISSTRPVKYKYILLSPSSEFPPSLVVSDPDSLRRYFVNHPLGPWAGWDSTGADTTRVQFINLTPEQRYVFCVISFDEAGDYSPLFDLSTNILHFRVSFDGYLGPRIRMIGPGFDYQYPTGGWSPDASREIPAKTDESRRVLFEWSAEPTGPCGSGDIRSYRWVLDPYDLTDETPRTDELTDLHHWSVRSLNVTSAIVGPFPLADPPTPEFHRFYVEVGDINGLRSLGIVRLEVNPFTNRPPDCSNATADPSEIWPPNHRFVPVSILGVTDPDADPIAITINGVTQDEPVLDRFSDEGDVAVGGTAHHPNVGRAVPADRGEGADDPDTDDSEAARLECRDAIIGPDGGVAVRAERSGRGNGRVYTIWFTASDGRGGSCDGSVRVCVPHDRRPGHVCVDDGLRYRSTAECSQPRGPARSVAGNRETVAAGPFLSLASMSGSRATFDFALAEDADVLLAVYDVGGRRMAILVGDRLGAGEHRASWNTVGVPSGIYFCRILTARGSATRSVLVLR